MKKNSYYQYMDKNCLSILYKLSANVLMLLWKVHEHFSNVVLTVNVFFFFVKFEGIFETFKKVLKCF